VFVLFAYLPRPPNNNDPMTNPAHHKLALWIVFFLISCGGLLLTGSATAEHQPKLFTAYYTVSKGIMPIGTTKRSLKKNKSGHYVFESLTKPEGIAKWFIKGNVLERSTWSFDSKQFIPREYEYNNSGSDKRRNVKLVFNWGKKQVTNIINGDPWTMPLDTGTLDKLLYQLVVMYDLTDNKTPLLYQVADGGKLKSYELAIGGEEKLQTELGTFDTVKISRIGKKRKIIFWCAKVLDYMPVRIQQQKQGASKFTADLVKLEGIAIPNNAKNISSEEDDF